MKTSKYTYFIEKSGKAICYSTLHDTMLLFSAKAYDVFKNEPLEVFQKNFPNNYQALIDHKILIDDNSDELGEIRMRNKMDAFSNRHFELTVLPSMDCNLRCWYCFEDHVPNSRMSAEIQERIVRMIEKKVEAREISGLTLDYFGGEPLLDFNTIAYPLAISLKKLMDKHQLPFSSFFTTNGSLIDEPMIEKLAELNPGFQITLDGNRERHDKIRFRKADKSGTYQHIIDTIYRLTQRLEHVYVNIRINYDEQTLRSINELLEDLSGLDRSKVGVHFERVWQTSTSVDNNELKQAINLFLSNGFKVSYINWHTRGCACKAERLNSLAVNYDGKVFKCTGRSFSDEQSDGELDDQGNVQWKNGRLERRVGKATFENDMCLECKMLPVCMGPCSQKQIDKGDCAEGLHDVCSLNTLEMKMGEYIEYLLNNMIVSQQSYR